MILSSRKILAILAWVYLERSWLLLGLRYLDGFLPQVVHERRDLLSCGVGTKAHWMEMWRLLDSGVWLGVWRPLAWAWEKKCGTLDLDLTEKKSGTNLEKT